MGPTRSRTFEAYKSTIGYVPEEPHLYSYLTGPEYLQLVGRLRCIPDAVLDDKIERFLQAPRDLRRSVSNALVLLEGHAAKGAHRRRRPSQPSHPDPGRSRSRVSM